MAPLRTRSRLRRTTALIYLGLDCGGSSTRALAVDQSGNTVFQGYGGPANLASTPDRKLHTSLRAALQDCPQPDFVCGCFAGLLTQDDRARAEDILRFFFKNASIQATPDYAAALYASDEGTDLCVIAGTGSLVCSKSEQGIAKGGGRGYLLGDHGSAFQYGKAALQHYLEGKPSEQLKAAVLKQFGTDDENEIVARVYRFGSPAATIARLAKAFALDLSAGEPYANATLVQETAKLSQITADHISEHFPSRSSLGVCLAGGLWQIASVFRETFLRNLKEKTEQVELVGTKIKNPPVTGAVRLAREMNSGN